ncbi:PIN domain-like protein [Linderina pennispora]|uniref:PIN domain-like protein n=1 Tax=Linderina pennispora TaxID=61395 RepID=A0A1Y1W9W0_9FUNG|nr:PIN domain-like protein [Linderina pennispora]ORX69934.1 PIN domain-like protein [Linderina pennispora]
MGVKGLTPLLARFAPASISTISPCTLSGWTLAVDTSIFIQRFFRSPSPSPQSRHIQGIYDLATYMHSLDITPIFIFDGATRARGKERELQKRRQDRIRLQQEYERAQARQQRIRTMQEIGIAVLEDMPGEISAESWEKSRAVEWLQEGLAREIMAGHTVDARLDVLEQEAAKTMLFQMGDSAVSADDLPEHNALELLAQLSSERLDVLARRAEPLTRQHVDECRQLVRALGYAAYTVEDAESESMCAALVKGGVADAVCTEDLDVLAFGGRLVRSFYTPGQDVLVMDVQQAIAGLGLKDMHQFRDLCILCGTDFASTLERVGPVTALKLIKKFGTIEQILESGTYRQRDGFDYQLAREIFGRNVKLPFSTREEVRPRSADRAELDRLQRLFGVRLLAGQAAGLDPFAAGALF